MRLDVFIDHVVAQTPPPPIAQPRRRRWISFAAGFFLTMAVAAGVGAYGEAVGDKILAQLGAFAHISEPTLVLVGIGLAIMAIRD